MDSLQAYLMPLPTNEELLADDNELPQDNEAWSVQEAIEAIRSRGYIDDLPSWLISDGSKMAKEELNATLSMLYYFINQMERVTETTNGLSLSPKEGEDDLVLSGFGVEDLDVQTRLGRLSADREHLLQIRTQLVEQLQHSRHENAVLAQRMASAESQWKEATKQVTNERDLLRRQVADYKQRETQHQHEIRRHEMDAEALREKLRNALSSGAKISKPAISSLPEGFSKPSSSSTSSSASFQSQSVTLAHQKAEASAQKTLKVRLDEVERENEQLRVLLSTMTDQVDELLGGKSSTTASSKSTSVKSTMPDLSALQALIKQQMERLRSSSPRSVVSALTGGDIYAEAENLRTQLADAQRLIDEQHKLLVLAVSSEPNRLFTPSE